MIASRLACPARRLGSEPASLVDLRYLTESTESTRPSKPYNDVDIPCPNLIPMILIEHQERTAQFGSTPMSIVRNAGFPLPVQITAHYDYDLPG